jgi:hypothetical protein
MADEFVELTPAERGLTSPADAAPLLDTPAEPLEPMVINDRRAQTITEADALTEMYYGRHGTAYYILRDDEAAGPRPAVAGHHAAAGGSGFRWTTRSTTSASAWSRASAWSTASSRCTTRALGRDRLRWLYAHQAGIGSCGAIVTTVIHAEVAPHVDGFTYFQNVALACLALAGSTPRRSARCSCPTC